jgi:hypothetical protein
MDLLLFHNKKIFIIENNNALEGLKPFSRDGNGDVAKEEKLDRFAGPW